MCSRVKIKFSCTCQNPRSRTFARKGAYHLTVFPSLSPLCCSHGPGKVLDRPWGFQQKTRPSPSYCNPLLSAHSFSSHMHVGLRLLWRAPVSSASVNLVSLARASSFSFGPFHSSSPLLSGPFQVEPTRTKRERTSGNIEQAFQFLPVTLIHVRFFSILSYPPVWPVSVKLASELIQIYIQREVQGSLLFVTNMRTPADMPLDAC